jgi:hypothetical protein
MMEFEKGNLIIFDRFSCYWGKEMWAERIFSVLTIFILTLSMFFVFEVPIVHSSIFDVNSAVQPDLVVSDFWREGSSIFYQVLNVGNYIAEGVHADALFINDTNTAENSIDRSLMPGEHYEGTFPFLVGGSGENPPDVIPLSVVYRLVITTDVNNTIAESNETNNSLEKIWASDLTPPVILTRPAAYSVTQTSAVISWVTDELSDSRVEYGQNSLTYDFNATSSEFVTAHNVTLTELQPSTTYHFVVHSTDPSGNTVQSGVNAFQTMAVSDNSFPVLSMVGIPSVVEGALSVEAQAFDDTGLEKVEFFIDDALVFTDFSPPYRLSLDSSEYLNGQHKLTAKAFDLAGNPTSSDQAIDVENLKDATVPTVTISSPTDGEHVSGIVGVNVHIHDDVGLDSARFYVNGSYTEYTFIGGSKFFDDTYTFDVRNMDDGTKLTFAVETWDTSSNLGSANVRVFVYNVVPPPTFPWLEVTEHVVSRSNNLFTITLGIQNVGNAPAYNVKILDGLKGFQPISANLPEANYSANWDPVSNWAAMYIKPKPKNPIYALINPGESLTFTYNAVPVLVTVSSTPEIGFFIDLNWQDSLSSFAIEYDNYRQLPVSKTTGGESIPQAHAEAVKTCDYLIVTNPYELFAYYDPGYYSEPIFNPTQAKMDVNALLSKMAQLARYEQGTLGYFTWNYAYPEQVLHNLIQQGGTWSSKLTSDWTSNGYLLIVGETEIIPAWHRVIGPFKTTEGDLYYNVLTDLPYANTFGEEKIPELSIGRIIGNNAKELTTVIDTSLSVYLGIPGHQFDRSDVLAVSGTPGFPPNVMDFKVERDAVMKAIAQKTPSSVQFDMHTPDFIVLNSTGGIDWPATNDLIQKAVLSATSNNDVIFLAGHGSPQGWDGVNTGDVMAKNNLFGTTSPFVFASSCKTGAYFGVFSLAESFLQKGAAVYLGATANGLSSGGSQAVKFFELWDTNEPISSAVKQTKREIGDAQSDIVWRNVYHVYGDAKFGATQSAAAYSSSALSLIAEALPPSSIDVTIPDYNITNVDGIDYVEIPTGLQMLEAGMPQVPYFKVLYEYPKGYRIQDVSLTYQSEPLSATNLTIPNAVLALPGNGATILPQSESSSDWFPSKDFEWAVYEGPDSTTLAITIYPFHYNPLTKNAKFFKEFSFNVDYVRSNVKITGLKADKLVYDLGDEVHFDLDLSNVDVNSKDVVVSAVIMDEGSGRVVGGSSLRSLMGLTGRAFYSSSWSSGAADPGDYSLIVEVRDAQGILLDKRIESFSLASLDSNAPTTTLTKGEPKYIDLSGNVYLTSSTPLTLTAEDNVGGTGVASIGYRIRNATQNFGWITSAFPIQFYMIGLADGAYFIDYNSTDTKGNVELTNTAIVILDDTPPETALTIGDPQYVSNKPYVTSDTPFTLEATDVGSGVKLTAYRITNSSGYDSGWLTYTEQFNLTSLSDGNYTIAYNSTDNVGNVEATDMMDVVLFSWNHAFKDSDGRGTTLKINTAYKFFEFIAPDRDFGIKYAPKMTQLCRQIIISCYEDSQIRFTAIAVDDTTCLASACDKQTGRTYWLVEHPPTYKLSVYCKDLNGKAISCASVYFNGCYRGQTDSNGKLVITNVLSGTYIVTVKKCGYKDSSGSITVTGDATLTLTMNLQTYTLTVCCKDSKGKAVSDVSVYVNSIYRGTTDLNGKLVITNITAGTYTMTAKKTGYKDTSISITVSSDKTVTITMK